MCAASILKQQKEREEQQKELERQQLAKEEEGEVPVPPDNTPADQEEPPVPEAECEETVAVSSLVCPFLCACRIKSDVFINVKILIFIFFVSKK